MTDEYKAITARIIDELKADKTSFHRAKDVLITAVKAWIGDISGRSSGSSSTVNKLLQFKFPRKLYNYHPASLTV